MKLNVKREQARLERSTNDQLRSEFARVFGEATAGRHRTWLVRRILWRLQARAEGGLSERAQRRAEELADEADLRRTPPAERKRPHPSPVEPSRRTGDPRLPPPGSVIARTYKKRRLQVLVLERGFEYEGARYSSLSALARAISGSHVNGFQFFRLGGQEKRA